MMTLIEQLGCFAAETSHDQLPLDVSLSVPQRIVDILGLIQERLQTGARGLQVFQPRLNLKGQAGDLSNPYNQLIYRKRLACLQ